MTKAGVELFKTMGAYDEFKEKPTHGLFLIDPSAIYGVSQLEHAYSNIPFVEEEWRRLQRIAAPMINARSSESPRVAYFSMEVGLSADIPITAVA